MSRLTALSMIALIALMLPVVAAAQPMILSLRGTTANYQLVRKGRAVPLALLLPLQTDDRLKVLWPTGVLVYRRADGVVDKLQAKDGEIRIGAPVEGLPILANLYRMAGDALTRHQARSANVTTRGPDERLRSGALSWTLPGLQGGNASIAAGSRPFALAWRGGQGPFRIRLTDPSGRLILDEAEILSQQFITLQPLLTIMPGRYAIHLSDRTGAKLSTSIIAYAAPPLPAPTEGDKTIEAGEAILRSAQLLNERGWAYEAYVSLALYYECDDTAAAFMDNMAVGAIK